MQGVVRSDPQDCWRGDKSRQGEQLWSPGGRAEQAESRRRASGKGGEEARGLRVAGPSRRFYVRSQQ